MEKDDLDALVADTSDRAGYDYMRDANHNSVIETYTVKVLDGKIVLAEKSKSLICFFPKEDCYPDGSVKI